MAYTQENRLMTIETPLGENVLLLQGFSGREGISRLFSFQVNLLSEDHAVAFESLVGQPVTISLGLAEGSKRPINGIVSRFARSGSDERFAYYRAEVVPWLWFLTRTTDCRIFQNMTIPDIITTIFRDLGFSDFRNALQGSFEPCEYCVQYRETDFNFVSRLMEQYGIFYFFEHTKDKHTLVLADSPTAHVSCPEQASARYNYTGGTALEEDVISTWEMEQGLRSGKYALTDYNFETPSTSLLANVSSTVHVGGNGNYEMYDYPGEYLKKAQGEQVVKLRMEEEEAPHMIASGTSTCRVFIPGYRFDLKEHPFQAMNKTYVLTEVQHVATVGGNYPQGAADEESYSNHFTCIPSTVPFRPPRVTPKPVVQGPQTAVVVGKSGEEIWTDKYGRVKVQFHWDREGKYNENSSCWIRVAQNWAGKRWGMMFLPRIGQEVIVDFLEGDPDRPIITGRVYNAEEMPPYDLPAEQTKSTIKSRSSKGDGVQGFNEVRFEDKKSEEQLFIHAERNQDIRVKKDLFETIGGEGHFIVTKDQFEAVKGDQHQHVTGDQNAKVDGTISRHAGMDMQEKADMKFALDAGMEIHLKAGMNLVIESGTTLTLKVGSNFINLNPAGVFISGTLVMINSGGAAGSGSGASPEAPQDPQEADKAEGGEKSQLPPPPPPLAPVSYSPAALVMLKAAENGSPFCET